MTFPVPVTVRGLAWHETSSQVLVLCLAQY